jgi:hypothetical protein
MRLASVLAKISVAVNVRVIAARDIVTELPVFRDTKYPSISDGLFTNSSGANAEEADKFIH